MYQLIANNQVRKMPDFLKPDRAMMRYHMLGSYQEGDRCFELDEKIYEEALTNAPTFPVSGNHNWKEGQLIPDDEITIVEKYFTAAGSEGFKYVAIPKQAEPSTGSEEVKHKQVRIIVRFEYCATPEGLNDADVEDFKQQSWLAWFDHPDLKGNICSGATKAEAWKELMLSFQLLVAHWSGISGEEFKQLLNLTTNKT